jgi:hypothetical protein
MPKKTAKKTIRRTPAQPRASASLVMRNQFFGMLLVAIGIGALIVVVRYFVISLQVPTDVYLIETNQLIPGAQQ